ncbi:MAG: hypothetical protein RLZZ387_4735 [Chloroflexota bacterium]|jgi:CheY-like chemotaxis protein
MARDQTLVLVADDDPAIAGLIRELLADEGYDTVCCHSGTAALNAIDTEQPDLIIVDLQMEQRDSGLRVAAALRGHPGLRHVPVILCSAAVPLLADLGPTLRQLGCVAMPKPFDVMNLLATVEVLLGRIQMPPG